MPVDPNYQYDPVSKRFQYRGWGYPDILRFKGSVIPPTIPVLFFTALLSSLVAVIYKILLIDVTLPNTLIGAVSVVVALLLAFRTNNAYDRYYEGRKLFANMCTEIRNATRNIWVGVKENNEKEKEENIKLLLAFAIAVKHHLRFEFGTDYHDLKDLLPKGLQVTTFEGITPEENTVSRSESVEDPKRVVPGEKKSLQHIATRIPPTVYDNLRNTYSRDKTTIWFGASEWGNEVNASMSLPLELIFHIALYNKKQNKADTIYGVISSNLNNLVEIFGNLERISNTPIPFAYNVHLKQAVTIYVWILPFTLVSILGWFVIPVVVLVGFILFGVEAIGAEIENPFGYDANDLPLDGYCQDLEAEIQYLERHVPSGKKSDKKIF